MAMKSWVSCSHRRVVFSTTYISTISIKLILCICAGFGKFVSLESSQKDVKSWISNRQQVIDSYVQTLAKIVGSKRHEHMSDWLIDVSWFLRLHSVIFSSFDPYVAREFKDYIGPGSSKLGFKTTTSTIWAVGGAANKTKNSDVSRQARVPLQLMTKCLGGQPASREVQLNELFQKHLGDKQAHADDSELYGSFREHYRISDV
ncbi:hypothetical protein Bca4012_066620 [Brassica carinata]